MSISWDIHYLITRGGMTGRLLLWFSYGRHGRPISLAVAKASPLKPSRTFGHLLRVAVLVVTRCPQANSGSELPFVEAGGVSTKHIRTRLGDFNVVTSSSCVENAGYGAAGAHGFGIAIPHGDVVKCSCGRQLAVPAKLARFNCSGEKQLAALDAPGH